VTALRKKMTDELVRRNYSEGTARAYLRSVEQFARYFNRPPDQLGREHIREYAAHLFEARQLSSSSVCQQVAALRFFYVKTFRKGWSVEDTPYPKRGNSLPLILSVEEVSQTSRCRRYPIPPHVADDRLRYRRTTCRDR